MSYLDRTRTVVDSLDMGKPIFKVIVRDNRLLVKEESWHPNLDDSNLVNKLVNRHADRLFNRESKHFYIDFSSLMQSIDSEMLSDMLDIFIACSPYDAPRRTNVYKSFRDIVGREKRNLEFKKSMFDIFEYYTTTTVTDSISKSENDVHRKNIYHLLCLMEKSYGKNAKSNN